MNWNELSDSPRKEPQIIEYQTQQYRLFPALATSYAFYFASTNFIQYLLFTKDSTNNFEKINPANLNKVKSFFIFLTKKYLKILLFD